MRTIFFLAGISFLLPACGPAVESPPEAVPAAGSPAFPFPVGCYVQNLDDGSVISLSVNILYDDEVVGILDYSFQQKDGAHGTFRGRKEGNLIRADWTYTIEGFVQTEEVLLRLQGADRVEKAAGELQETPEGKLVLRDPASVRWEESFRRVPCEVE